MHKGQFYITSFFSPRLREASSVIYTKNKVTLRPTTSQIQTWSLSKMTLRSATFGSVTSTRLRRDADLVSSIYIVLFGDGIG